MEKARQQKFSWVTTIDTAADIYVGVSVSFVKCCKNRHLMTTVYVLDFSYVSWGHYLV